MLAIVESMDCYRHYFEGLGQTTTIFSDHHNLLWFTKTKVYNRRQARWAEKLSRFNFRIVFHSGKQEDKPDALSRRPDYTLGDDISERTMTFLKLEQMNISLLPTDDLVLAIYALAILDHATLVTIATVEELGPNEPWTMAIREALKQDGDVGPLLPYLRDPTLPRDEAVSEALQPFHLDDGGLLLRNGLVYILNEDALKLNLL